MTTRPAYPDAPIEHGRGVRVDGELKVSGQITFADDLALPGLLHVAVLRSPHPHARITRVDIEAARKTPGVADVLTGADVSGILVGRAMRDAPVIAHEKVRFAGEIVAAVAAETRTIAEEATLLIEVDYEPLPAVFDATEALQPDAPAVHDQPWTYPDAARGPDAPLNLVARNEAQHGDDIEAALAASHRVFDRTFSNQQTHHAYIEPASCTVAVTPDNKVSIWSNNKSAYRLRIDIGVPFGIPEEDFSVHTAAVGGDFGGKGVPMDMAFCLVLARRTGRPVRFTRRYVEELTASAGRHACVTRVRAGVSRDGRLQALDVHAVFNAGAYGGFRPTSNFAARAASGYRIPAVRIVLDRVYTNQVPSGNTRSPGQPQITFPVESMMDVAAREMGIDPMTFRRNNLLPEDAVTNSLGEHWPEIRARQVLDLADAAYRPAFPGSASSSIRFGRGIAIYDRPTHAPNRSSIRLRLTPGGMIEVQTPTMETGTGSHTVIRRVVADTLGLSVDQVAIRYVSTTELPWDAGVGGSRVTGTASETAHRGALAFRRELTEQMARALGVTAEQIELRPGGVGVVGGSTAGRRPLPEALEGRSLSLSELAARGVTVEVMTDTGGHPHGPEGVTNFCAQIAQVGVDVETGQITVYEVLSVHDVAAVLNPNGHRGQIEGGVVQGLGWTLSEDLGMQDGVVTAAHLGDYKLPTFADVPPVRVELLTGGIGLGALNVKGIGELPNVPTGAAIANAVADAVGVRITSLPITAEKVRSALHTTVLPGG